MQEQKCFRITRRLESRGDLDDDRWVRIQPCPKIQRSRTAILELIIHIYPSDCNARCVRFPAELRHAGCTQA